MQTTTCLVTGATGAIGPCIVKALQQAGYNIRILSRNMPNMQLFSDKVDVHIGDITNVKTLENAVQGCDSIVHLAALLHIGNPPTSLHSEYERINIEGTSNLVNAAVYAGIQRFVFMSTIKVYGASNGQILYEETLPRPDTLYGQTKLAGEQIVLRARRADGQFFGTVLRLSAVYGTRVKGNYQRLLYSLARGHFIPIGQGHNRRTLVYDRDVAAATVLALQHPHAVGRIYNVTDGQWHTMQEIIQVIASGLGRWPSPLSLPVGPTRWLAGLIEDSARFCGYRSPVGRATLDTYTEDIAVDGQRIQQELGFTPHFDLATGWQDAIQNMHLNDV